MEKITHTIASCTINFFITPNAISGYRVGRGERGERHPRSALSRDRILGYMNDLIAALEKIPIQHLSLLIDVPIIIFNVPARGGWVAPIADGYPSWVSGSRVNSRFGGGGEAIREVPYSKGIITITTAALQDSIRQLTILHETGHCVDYHMGLGEAHYRGLSSLPHLDYSYRIKGPQGHQRANLAYQGQRYGRGRGENRYYRYTEKEFKAETYSRLFIRPRGMCRGEGNRPAQPACITDDNHRDCSVRLQQDLANTPAFRGIDRVRFFPLLANIANESPTLAHNAQGPVLDPVLSPRNPQLSPHGGCRSRGSIGCD